MRNPYRVNGALLIAVLLCVGPAQTAWANSQTIGIQSTATQAQSAVPISFGLVFSQGLVTIDQPLQARPFSGGASIPLQIDRKATYPDGSLRHAVASAVLPSLGAGDTRIFTIEPAMAEPSGLAVASSDLSDRDRSFTVRLTIDDIEYVASLHEALGNVQMQWLRGPIASEWITSAAFKRTSDGVAHPHLNARFHVRKYSGSGQLKVDFVLENNTTWTPGLRNYTYNVDIKANGESIYTLQGLTHFVMARWKKTFWLGPEPQVHIRHDPMALMATGAVPNYDPALIGDLSQPVQAVLQQYERFYGQEIVQISGYTVDRYGPMGIGIANFEMPAPGGRGDIGPIPVWGVNYLLTQDARAKHATIRMSDLAGSWSIHYRDERTGLPLSIEDYPEISNHGNASIHHRTPPTVSPDGRPYHSDSAHQPGFNFLAYLVTGDFYHIEEMHFWLAYIFVRMPNGAVNEDGSYPGDVWYAYRGRQLGMVITHDELRAKAWALRTVAQIAAFTPLDHPQKQYYERVLANNIREGSYWVINNRESGYNSLGYGHHNHFDLPNWMDDFFTWAIVYTTQLGFDFPELNELADWKVKWVINRHGFGQDNPYCWNAAAAFRLWHRDSEGNYLKTMRQFWDRNKDGQNASYIPTNDCTKNGYQAAENIIGYPSNMQPALAAAVDRRAEYADEAWALFAGRAEKPDYRGFAVWAIVPRGGEGGHSNRPNPPRNVVAN